MFRPISCYNNTIILIQVGVYCPHVEAIVFHYYILSLFYFSLKPNLEKKKLTTEEQTLKNSIVKDPISKLVLK